MSDRASARPLSRRRLLISGATLAGAALLQACGGAAPAPTPPPAKPVEPAAIPTPVPEKAAAAAPTPAAAAPQPTATPAASAPAAPAVAQPTATARASVPREKTLIVGFEGGPVQAPEIANPYVPGARINQGYHQLMIESLYYLNYETGQAIPWLAEGHEYNRDFTSVDIRLRGGVTWSDGKPFGPDDVVYTLNMLRDNPGLQYGPEMQRFVKEATAPGPYTVRVTLKEPYPRFIFNNFTIHIWGAVRILPKHIWAEQDPMKFTFFDPSKGWPVWTGPYRLVKADANQFVYDRRDDWWAARTMFKNLPAPERVVFVDAGATDKKAAALEANEVDGQPSLAVDAFMKVREKNKNAIGWLDEPPYAWIDPCPATLGFNNELAPWNDPQMRWAVNLGIDKKKLADAYGFGFGMPARYNFPFYAPLESILNENNDLFQKYNVLEFNPRKAMEMIEGKGFKKGGDGVYAKDGQPLKVDLLVKAAAVTQPTVSLLVTFMKGIGIDAAPQALADTQYHDRRNRADFQLETTHVACGSVVDPFAELNLLHSQWIRAKGEVRSNNLWGYKNPEYDAVVDKIRLLPPGDAGLKPLTRQALEMRLRDLPFIPLAQQFRVVPYSTKYWTNWPTAKNNYFHPPNWWNCFLIPVLNIKPA
ncbi:MAG TPA: ABC transporter substrate-binding protein [Chloroflexota bacterium]|nr:ABC transporter substrate-binding protein [Chloroflexota bacterium]